MVVRVDRQSMFILVDCIVKTACRLESGAEGGVSIIVVRARCSIPLQVFDGRFIVFAIKCRLPPAELNCERLRSCNWNEDRKEHQSADR